MNTVGRFQLRLGAIPVPADVATLRWLCREFRQGRLDLTKHSGTGFSHIGGELSLVEILAVLFFHALRLDPKNPDWPERDRFLLSKGHASAAMYVGMAWRGFFPRERLFDSYNRPHAILQEHVNHERNALPRGEIWGLVLCSGPSFRVDTESSRAFWIPASAGMTTWRQAVGNEPSRIQDQVILS